MLRVLLHSLFSNIGSELEKLSISHSVRTLVLSGEVKLQEVIEHQVKHLCT
ncbi:unnamed protein product [Moneuplotes crassus]|uniref:Uncharacterized protein n=1 Tax=Euplotes crassus TaxID=5936 RepID=A0AAD2D943_EUPCR|nr:unnamed protein product [Moneuplotes crassus]